MRNERRAIKTGLEFIILCRKHWLKVVTSRQKKRISTLLFLVRWLDRYYVLWKSLYLRFYTRESDKLNSSAPCAGAFFPLQLMGLCLIFVLLQLMVTVPYIRSASVDGDCEYDYVKVFDGATEGATCLGKFCGNSIPGPFRSTSSSLFVKFVTDASVSHTGFSADYTTYRGLYGHWGI